MHISGKTEGSHIKRLVSIISINAYDFIQFSFLEYVWLAIIMTILFNAYQMRFSTELLYAHFKPQLCSFECYLILGRVPFTSETDPAGTRL